MKRERPHKGRHTPAERGKARDLGETFDAVVVASHGAEHELLTAAGDRIRCSARTALPHPPVCGDRVTWRKEESGNGVIVAIHERQSVLRRTSAGGQHKTMAANLDCICIVTAVEPPPDLGLLDRFLVAAEVTAIPALIVLNKVDLVSTERLQQLLQGFASYTAIGYPLITASCHSQHGLDDLQEIVRHKRTILAGQSGVGKSSLANALLPGTDARTGALQNDGHGSHTTSTARLYPLGEGGLIDSPGIRGFHLESRDPHQIAEGFIEFRRHLGECRFRNCRHLDEPGCAIQAAVERGEIAHRRYAAYREMVERPT